MRPSRQGDSLCDVSVVVPTYGGEASLPKLCARLASVLDALQLRWELLLIDDASPDQKPVTCAKLTEQEPRIRYLRLPNNGGQHAATVVGLRRATGKLLVTLDDDLQQPPEALPMLLAALHRGAAVAIARFAQPAHPVWRRWGSSMLNFALKRSASAGGITITSFKAFRRDAAERMLAAVPTGVPFYLGPVLLATIPHQDIVNMDVTHYPRRYGRSGYGLRSLVKLGLNALRPSHVPGRR